MHLVFCDDVGGADVHDPNLKCSNSKVHIAVVPPDGVLFRQAYEAKDLQACRVILAITWDVAEFNADTGTSFVI